MISFQEVSLVCSLPHPRSLVVGSSGYHRRRPPRLRVLGFPANLRFSSDTPGLLGNPHPLPYALLPPAWDDANDSMPP